MRLRGKSPTASHGAIVTSRWGRVLAVVAAAIALVAHGRFVGAYLPAFARWVDGLGVWGPVVFIVGYALAAIAFVPGSILTLAAGAIFGVVRGVVYVFVAAVLGASGAFLVARHLARGTVERRLAGNVRFAAIDRAVGREGRKIVFLLRLSPVFPFNLLNYALGLTRVSFADYVVASIGMIPGTILYVYYGKLAGDVATLASGTAVEKGAGYYGVLALGLVATIVVTTLVTRTARRALDEVTTRA
jgi:uncharacterized membrane protein YdjX (TVP38/TMEM64 family)